MSTTSSPSSPTSPTSPTAATDPAGAGPRERLLRAAQVLTYTHGVGVGVDAILREAGVARRSLYQHFGGKDALVAEVLAISADADERRYRDALDTGGDDPRARLLALFDVLDQVTSAADFRGCRYTAADLALISPDHPAHAVVRAHKDRVHRLLRRELDRLGHPDPAGAANQILLLVDGVLMVAVTRPETRPARAARTLVARVLDG